MADGALQSTMACAMERTLELTTSPLDRIAELLPYLSGYKWFFHNAAEKYKFATQQAILSHVPEKVAKQILAVWPVQSGGARPYEPPRFVWRRHPHDKNC